MLSIRLVVVFALLAGCRGTPRTQELTVAHPAHPEASAAAYEPAPDPFMVTPTYGLPLPSAPMTEMNAAPQSPPQDRASAEPPAHEHGDEDR